MTWALLALTWIEHHLPELLDAGRAAGLHLPTEAELMREMNDAAAKALPALLTAVTVEAIAAGVAMEHDLAKIPDPLRCPVCSTVLTHRSNSTGALTFVCGACGWEGADPAKVG